jgi:hypothetical protein
LGRDGIEPKLEAGKARTDWDPTFRYSKEYPRT